MLHAKPPIYFIARNDLDHTVTLLVNGQRYEYHLTPQQVETVHQLCRKGLGRRALNYAKSHAKNVGLLVGVTHTST